MATKQVHADCCKSIALDVIIPDINGTSDGDISGHTVFSDEKKKRNSSYMLCFLVFNDET